MKATATDAVASFDPVQTPKLTETGSRKIEAPAARSTLIRPPPRAIGPSPEVPVTVRSALFTRADLISSGPQLGWSALRSAAEPAVWGVAIEVPWKKAYFPPRTLDRMLTPGAVTSGLIRKS